MRNLESYGIKSFYKGTFLGYEDPNYLDSEDFTAYIYIPDLILSKPTTEILTESTAFNTIKDREKLGIEPSINSINAVICKPLYINDVYPYVEIDDTVFVFLIDNDPKKLFYAKISTDKPMQDAITIRRGKNVISIDRDEIRLTREIPNPENDIGITVSRYGVEFSGNIIINGENVTDMFIGKGTEPEEPEVIKNENVSDS